MSTNKYTDETKKRRALSGFDMGMDYLPIKKQLMDEFIKQYNIYQTKNAVKKATKCLIFLLIEIIQLRNGSRVTEAINAFKIFGKSGIKKKAQVKIGKSVAKKNAWIHNKELDIKEKKQVLTTQRDREMMFPITWFEENNIFEKEISLLITDLCENNEELLKQQDRKLEQEGKIYTLRQKIYNYMKNNFKCNTHSLRYAFINHLIQEKKTPLPDVAQFVGHKSMNQLLTYTQRKHSNKIFDLEM